MLTEKDYCDYESCVALCELGMRVASRKVYKEKDAPLKSSSRGIIYTVRTASANGYVIGIPLYEAQKWLRKEKQIEILVHSFDYVGEPYFADIHIYREVRCACSYADSYEEALAEGVREAIKILKEK